MQLKAYAKAHVALYDIAQGSTDNAVVPVVHIVYATPEPSAIVLAKIPEAQKKRAKLSWHKRIAKYLSHVVGFFVVQVLACLILRPKLVAIPAAAVEQTIYFVGSRLAAAVRIFGVELFCDCIEYGQRVLDSFEVPTIHLARTQSSKPLIEDNGTFITFQCILAISSLVIIWYFPLEALSPSPEPLAN